MNVHPSHVVAVSLAGVLTGNELCTWAFVHPAAQRLEPDAEIQFEQTITRRMLAPMAVLMNLTVAAGVWSSVAGGMPARTLATTATGCYAVMVLVTLTGNMPLNVATLRTRHAPDTRRWRAVRRRWNLLHLVRNILNVTGLSLFAVAAARSLP